MDLNGTLTVNGDILLPDNDKLVLGTGSDMSLFSDGTTPFFNLGPLRDFSFTSDGVEKLFFDQSVNKFTLSTDVVIFTGHLRLASSAPTIRLQDTDLVDDQSWLLYEGGNFTIQGRTDAGVFINNSFLVDMNGATQLYYNGAISFLTTASGSEALGQLLVGSNVPLVLGGASQTFLMFNSATGSLELDVGATSDFRIQKQGAFKLTYDNSADQFDFYTNINIRDNVKLEFGTGVGTDLYYDSGVDAFRIDLSATADLILSDGGTPKLQYDSSAFQFDVSADIRLFDNIGLEIGAGADATLSSDGTNVILNMRTTADFFFMDAGATKLQWDASANQFDFSADIRLLDNIALEIGTGADGRLKSDGTNVELDLSTNADFSLKDNGAVRLQFDNSANKFNFRNGADILLDNNTLLQSRDNVGNTRGLVFMDSGNAVRVGDVSNAMELRNSGTLDITNHAGGTRDLHSLTPVAMGIIAVTGGFLSNYNFVSATLTGAGSYTVVTSPSVTSPILQVTPINTVTRMASVNPINATTFDVKIFNDAGTPSNSAFYMTVLDLSA